MIPGYNWATWGRGGGGSKFLHFYIEKIHVEKDSVKKAETCVKAQTVSLGKSGATKGGIFDKNRENSKPTMGLGNVRKIIGRFFNFLGTIYCT